MEKLNDMPIDYLDFASMHLNDTSLELRRQEWVVRKSFFEKNTQQVVVDDKNSIKINRVMVE